MPTKPTKTRKKGGETKPPKEPSVNRRKNGGARDSKGRFVKGNPGGGRPRLPEDVKKAFREKTQEALDCLVDILTNSESDVARVQAANAVLDRAWGKPPQATKIQGDPDNPIEHKHRGGREPASAEQIAATIAALRGGNESGE